MSPVVATSFECTPARGLLPKKSLSVKNTSSQSLPLISVIQSAGLPAECVLPVESIPQRHSKFINKSISSLGGLMKPIWRSDSQLNGRVEAMKKTAVRCGLFDLLPNRLSTLPKSARLAAH